MSETQTPEPFGPDGTFGPVAPVSPVREPEEPRRFDAPADNGGSGRYAAYDTTLGRYVGGVHDDPEQADQAGVDSGAETFEIVEV